MLGQEARLNYLNCRQPCQHHTVDRNMEGMFRTFFFTYLLCVLHRFSLNKKCIVTEKSKIFLYRLEWMVCFTTTGPVYSTICLYMYSNGCFKMVKKIKQTNALAIGQE